MLWMAGREYRSRTVSRRWTGGTTRLSRLVLRVIFHRVLSIATPIGRRLRPKMLHRAAPLIRTKGKDLTAAGVLRVPRVTGVRNGLPLLEDGRVLDVANVVWCTGFDAAFSWIDLPVFGGREFCLLRVVIVTAEQRSPLRIVLGCHQGDRPFLCDLEPARLHAIAVLAAAECLPDCLFGVRTCLVERRLEHHREAHAHADAFGTPARRAGRRYAPSAWARTIHRWQERRTCC